MATGGSEEGSSYEGGVGGKFRKRPAVRRSSTPYDRPSTAIRKTSEAGRTSWLLKLVDPASKIITTSAHKLFPSLFRNNNNKLPALPPIPEANHESWDEPPEVVSHKPTGLKERGSNEGYKLHSGSETNVINDLEQILKQKTFTRAEIDRLTELLQSKTVEVSAEGKKKRVEPCTLELAAAHETVDNVPFPLNQSQSMYKQTSTPAMQSTILEEDVAAPAELAKSYMGSKTITPSKLGLRSQASREAVATLNNLPFSPKSPEMSLVSKSAVNYNSAPRAYGNGYLIPGLRGRSALYAMARTPYSRVHNSSAQKDAGFMREASPSWENNMLSVGKQVSKRRSSVLDSDIGSVGPIRRIRQKTMMSPSTNMKLRTPGSYLSIPATSSGTKIGQVSTSLIQKYNNSEHGPLVNGDSIASTSFASVPPQSSETARKILQELDKLVSSPKEKSPELKLAMPLETSSSKLTYNMLHGKALKSMETVDSSKLLHALRDTADGVGNNHVVGARDLTSQSQVTINENGPNRGSISKDKSAIVNGLATAVPTEDTRPYAMIVDKVIPSIDASPSQKKSAFQMSAHEDYLDLDEDIFNAGVGSSTFPTDKGTLDMSLVESRSVETVTVEKPLVSSSDISSLTSEVMKKSNPFGSSNSPQTAEKDSGFNFSGTHASVTIPEPAPSTRQSSFSSPPSSNNVSTSASVFSFGSNSTNKATTFTFSTSVASESPASKFGGSDSLLPKFGLPSETLSSVTQAASSQTAPSAVEFDKGSKDGSQRTGDRVKKSENAESPAVSASTTPVFSFGASNSNTSPNNGPIASKSSLFSVAAAPATSDAPKSNDFSSISNASTAAAADMTRNSVSVSGENSTSSVPSLFQFGSGGAATPAKSISAPLQSASTSVPSLFQFGSGTAMAPAKSISAPLQSASSGLESADSDSKTKNSSPFENLSSSLFGTTSRSSGSGGGNFVFGSSASSNTKPLSPDNNQFQSSSTSATASGSSFSVLTASASTLAPTSQSMATQFTSSSPTFGLSGSSSLVNCGKLFGSGSGFTTSTMFSSSAGFTSSLFSSTTQTSAGSACSLFSSNAPTNAGSTSSLFSSTAQTNAGSTSSLFSSTALTSVGSGSASSLFGSSSQPATSSIFGSGFGSTSSSTGFAFGSSLSPSATGGSAPMTFGSSIGVSSSPMFSFSSAAPTSSTPNSSAFPVFAASTVATTFGSASPGNDQMNMEDSMAEDTMQASPLTVPAFAQPANSPQSNFVFGSPSGPNIFQMNGQQPSATPQSQSPFQASGSLGISAGGSFSLGTTTTGGDKSGRKIIKVRRDRTRKR